jgi:small subunit ribosomal protein S18
MIVKKKIRRTSKPCQFCLKKAEPLFSDIEGLAPFVDAKKRLITRYMTGNCQKHQLRLARAVKQARHLALMPFTDRV